MPRLTTTLNVAIAGGSNISVSSDVIEAQAIDQIAVILEPDDNTTTVEIQPSAASQIHALLISSSGYGSHLSYVFSDGSLDAEPTLILDGPHMFSSGNLAAIGVNPTLIRLTLAAAAGEAATVSIFVARDATP